MSIEDVKQILFLFIIRTQEFLEIKYTPFFWQLYGKGKTYCDVISIQFITKKRRCSGDFT